VCDEEANRILDLTDNIKVFMTNCRGSNSSSILGTISPTLDDQIKVEKNELGVMLNKLQEAVKRKNLSIKED